MAQERLTKDQKRDYARELARIEREKRLKAQARNRVLVRVGATVGVLAVLGAVAGGIWLATRPAGPGPANMASDGILFVGGDDDVRVIETPGIADGDEPVATDPDAYDAPLRIVTYIDYGCPFCGQFETANAAQIEELVASGQATLEVHPISILDRAFLAPYPTRAANAAACFAAEAPDSFLDFNVAMFAAQPAEESAGYTNGEIIDLLETAGIETGPVASCINDGTYNGWVAAATERATEGPLPNTEVENVSGTPTVLVNGIRYQPNDLGDPAEFAAFLQFVLASDSPSDDSGDSSEDAPAPQ